MDRPLGEYRPSRCTDPSTGRQTMHWATVAGTSNFVQSELVEAVRRSVGKKMQLDVLAEITAVLERVLACQAVDPEDVRNLERCRDLWEIRFQVRSVGLSLRVYTTEVPEAPQHIIALLAHVKRVAGLDSEEIAREQNDRIDEAARRLVAGRRDMWGLR